MRFLQNEVKGHLASYLKKYKKTLILKLHLEKSIIRIKLPTV